MPANINYYFFMSISCFSACWDLHLQAQQGVTSLDKLQEHRDNAASAVGWQDCAGHGWCTMQYTNGDAESTPRLR